MAVRRALLAGFATAEPLVAALRQLREAGFRRLDAFTPCAVEEVATLVAPRVAPLGLIILAAGMIGLVLGYATEQFGAVDYLIDIGGRPPVSWPAFVPIAFEIAVLWAVVAGGLGIVLAGRLPDLGNPAFDATDFEAASQYRFLLRVTVADDEGKDRAGAILAAAAPISLAEVRW